MKPWLMEHRWGERLQVDFPVRVTALRFSVRTGRLTDLSVSGALIHADLDARLLCRIQVAIMMPLWSKHEPPLVEAYVARKHKNGFGVEWCEFAPPSIGNLLRTLATRPHSHLRRPPAFASPGLARLSEPLLKHGT
jgi:hypothetical protein